MHNVMVLEDAEAGVKAANAAGIISIWVPDPRTPEDTTVVAFKRLKSLEHFSPEEFGIAPF